MYRISIFKPQYFGISLPISVKESPLQTGFEGKDEGFRCQAVPIFASVGYRALFQTKEDFGKDLYLSLFAKSLRVMCGTSLVFQQQSHYGNHALAKLTMQVLR